MHSGNQLTGSVCECMDCARARHERVERAARLSRSIELASLDEIEGEGELLINRGQKVKAGVKEQRRRIFNEVRENLIKALEEDDAQSSLL